MAAIGEEERVANGKIFELYSLMPFELRAMVVDEMRPDDRCRFVRCSALCETEARVSKKYLYSLVFIIHSENRIVIRARYANEDIHAHTGYNLEFLVENQTLKMIYRNRQEQQLWSISFRDSRIEEKALEWFNKLLKHHRSSIKILCIELRAPLNINFDFEGTKWKSLEELRIYGNVDCLQLISKLQYPLKLKRVKIENNNYELFQTEEYYRFDRLFHNRLRLNNAEFRQLSAVFLHIPIGSLTPEDIHTFVKDWVNGKIRKGIKEIVFLTLQRFDLNELFRLLEWPDLGGHPKYFYIGNSGERMMFKFDIQTMVIEIRFDHQQVA